jgi:hypothetical protein
LVIFIIIFNLIAIVTSVPPISAQLIDPDASPRLKPAAAPSSGGDYSDGVISAEEAKSQREKLRARAAADEKDRRSAHDKVKKASEHNSDNALKIVIVVYHTIP